MKSASFHPLAFPWTNCSARVPAPHARVVSTSIEALEDRIAPAGFLTFMDVDGDTVSLVSNKALTGTVTFNAAGNPSEILITGAGLDGASLTTVVVKGPAGDGFVNIGRIVATGLDLGVVTVKGDLGKIVCGNGSNPLPGLQALKVRSMGLYGADTQKAGDAQTDLVSSIAGDAGSIAIAGDALGVRINVGGKLGTVKIGGDLRGTGTSFSGRIQANGMKSVSIGGDLAAGTGDESGKLAVTGDLGKLSIGGAVYGALDAVADPLTGQITVTGNAGAIAIKRDVFGAQSEQKTLDLRGNVAAITIGGSIFGQAGKNSGAIYVLGNAGPVTIARDLNGGGALYSGYLFIAGNAGPVKIGHDLNGGAGAFSAAVEIDGTVGGFTVGRDLRGGTGDYQDGFTVLQVSLQDSTGPVKIGGDIIGGPSRGSGNFQLSGSAPSFYLGGSLLGGGVDVPGFGGLPGGSLGLGSVGSLTIVGSVRESPFNGGQLGAGTVGKFLLKGSIIATTTSATFSTPGPILVIGTLTTGRIEGSIVGSPTATTTDYDVRLGGNIAKLEILGSLDGGNSSRSGSVTINGNPQVVKIGGSLRSGGNQDTGSLNINGTVGSLTIGGSVVGQSGAFTAAQVTAQGYGKVVVGGDLLGGNAGGGELRATVGGFAGITIAGSLYAGNSGGAITAAKGLGAVKIGGSVSGSFGMNQNSIIALSATSITIGGDVFANGNGGNAILNIRETAGVIKIGGDIRGGANEPARLLFSRTAGFTGPAFVSLSVKGSVTNALITGGLRNDLIGENGDAVLGAINVGGDWIASSVTAGVAPGGDNQFGNASDVTVSNMTPAVSRIAAITIKGQVLGSAAMNDHFGFVAQSIGPVKIGGVAYTPGAAPIELSGISDDVSIRVVP